MAGPNSCVFCSASTPTMSFFKCEYDHKAWDLVIGLVITEHPDMVKSLRPKETWKGQIILQGDLRPHDIARCWATLEKE